MYLIVVIGLTFVLPAASVLIEWLLPGHAGLIFLIGKWFVFWAVGVRLLTAGVRQMAQPEFTARTIFEIRDPDASKIVSELGAANVAIGSIGVASLYFEAWVLPAAVCGFIFYTLVGVRHLRNRQRKPDENLATYSDLWVAVVLAIYLIGLVAA
ncbi:DUF6790 family protein [Brevundimonas lenta]|uniref:Uncharacterized protein n=1 Tax=Brevundimonas lenta TaxID=424796 RepID=A0A7W6NPJ8_9CAUL|nr:DUF6790 family protein [Brevundimonas lenta]MBB4082609.1 hypothetical protein [Brevundimonas lenta]